MKKKSFKEKVQELWAELGFSKKVDEQGKLADEHWKEFAAAYQKKHGSDFYADSESSEKEAEENEENAKKAAAHDAALQLLNQTTEKPNGEVPAGGSVEGAEKHQDLEKGMRVITEKVSSLEKENKQMRVVFEKVNNENVETVEVVLNATGAGMKHSETHLYSVKDPIFAIENRWNQLFLNANAIHGMGDADESVVDSFNKQANGFAAKVANGIRMLHAAGQLNPELLRSSSNPDLTALTNAGLGDQFVQFRTRELLARVFELPDIFGIFPKRSGIQDRDLITNAFVGELTQAWQDSETSLKGSVSLDPELGYVDDAMILSKFGSFKELERKYIGYLNTNGSDPVKWSMIEWSLLMYMMQARKEQMERYIRGIYLKPVAGTAGHKLNASTGIVNRILLYNIERKLRVDEDATMNTYDSTGTVFIDTLIEFGNWLIENVCPLGINQSDIKLYANDNHKQWFKTGYRSKYALHGDFTGTETAKIPDTEIGIIWVPNMAGLKMFWATTPGNMQCLENIPGEMNKFYLERRLNNVYAQATWKEGTSAAFAGLKTDTEANLADRAWDKQMIWYPKPYTALLADATTADAAAGFWFKTIANTAPTAITTISNKVAGQLYIIECGSLTNATTIAKAGDFSELTAAWTPTAVKDSIGVVWDAGASKFKEIFRKVGGTLAYNSLTSPNAIGAR
jgi:hypothetical protein